MSHIYTLEELQRMVYGCRRCQLCQGRTNTVFGEGNPQASLMFIGEGPGRDEDLQGRPFVGRAGQLLDRMIGAMGLQRQQVYIGNIVKCRPPNNRTPFPEEAAACVNYIKWQIYLVRPKVIVLLGATAAHALLDDPRGIMRLRGNWLNYQGIPVMPTFHPAYLLRNENAMQDVWQDLQQVMARL